MRDAGVCWSGLLVVLGGWLAVGGLPPTSAAADDDDDRPSYSYVLRERRVELKANGEKVVRLRHRLKVLTLAAVEDVGEVSIPYNSFREQARFLRAVTRAADGREWPVKADEVRDLAADEGKNYAMYSDARQLSFSMPQVKTGVTLDYEVEITSKPVVPGQTWDLYEFDSSVPVAETRYVLTAPKGVTLTCEARNLELAPTVTTTDTTETREWVLRDLPEPRWEAGMPPWADVRPSVRWTTVQDWAELQRWYLAVIAKADQPSPALAAKVRDLTAGLQTETERVRAVLRFVQKDVRYVGLELGHSAYEPHPPAESLEHRYGDCKDQSLLLRALLREIGVAADLALVQPAPGGSVWHQAPSLDQFGHMIVHVPRPDGALWLDPTAGYLDERSYPAELDGCEALVLGRGNTTFVTIPAPPAEQHVQRYIYDVTPGYDGYAVVKYTIEYVGREGAGTREEFVDQTPKEYQRLAEKWVRDRGASAHLRDQGFSDPYDLSGPFREWVVYECEDFLAQTTSGFALDLSMSNPPRWLRLPQQKPRAGKRVAEPRRHPWQRRDSGGEETVYLFHLPPALAPVALPPPCELTLPQGRVRIAVTQEGDVVRGLRGAYFTPCRLAATELETERLKTERALAQTTRRLELVNEVQQLLERRQPGAARARAEALGQAAPTNAAVQQLLGHTYQACGRLERARQAYREAIRLEPARFAFHRDLAMTYAGYAGEFGPGFDRARVLATIRAALPVVSHPRAARRFLAACAECNAEGEARGPGSSLDEAIGLYRELLAEDPEDTQPLSAMAECFYESRRYAEAEKHFLEVLAKQPDDFSTQGSLWVCAAMQGRTEEAIAAIHAAYDQRNDEASELARVARQLLCHRRYAAAADLMEAAMAANVQNKETDAALVKVLRLLAPAPLLDYRTWQDLSSPEAALRTHFTAVLKGDSARLTASVSPRAGYSTNDLANLIREYARGAREKDITSVQDFLLDQMATVWRYERRERPGGLVEVTGRMPPELAKATTGGDGVVVGLFEPGPEGWRAYGVAGQMLPNETLARVALDRLTREDLPVASGYADLLCENLQRSRGVQQQAWAPVRLCDITYPTPALRVAALAGIVTATPSAAARGRAALAQVSAALPDDPIVRRVIGTWLAQRRFLAPAITTLTAALTDTPEDRQLLDRLFDAQLNLGRHGAAQATLERLAALMPGAALVMDSRFRLLQDQEEYAQARALLEEQRPKLTAELAWRRDLLTAGSAGDLDRLAKLVAEVPKDEQGKIPRFLPVYAYCLAGATALELEQSERWLLDEPLEGNALEHVAQALIRTGDLADARDLLRRLQAMPARYVYGQRSRAALALAVGDYVLARDGLTEIWQDLTVDNSVYAGIYLGLAHLAQGDRDAAVRVWRQAATQLPGDDWPRGALRLLLGELTLPQALAIADQAEAATWRRTYRTEALCYGGLLARVAGRTDEARTCFRQVLDLKNGRDLEFSIAAGELHRLGP